MADDEPRKVNIESNEPEQEADKTVELDEGAFKAYLKLYDKDPDAADAAIPPEDEPPPEK